MFALCLSGLHGSGKTSLARALAADLQIPFASFGDHVREAALGRGRTLSIEDLRKTADELIAGGWARFCSEVLHAGGWNSGDSIVVDGIRHVEALDAIATIVSPAKTVLVSLRLDEATRTKRLLGRGVSPSRLASALSDPIEEQIRSGALEDRADIVLDGYLSVPALVGQIKRILPATRGTDSASR